MALIKCPECQHEVSEHAASCPNCGFGIKEHFDAIKEHQRKLEIFNTQEEIRQKQREERINNVSALESPRITVPIVLFILSIIFVLGGIKLLSASDWDVEYSVSHGDGNPHFYGAVGIITAICLLGYGICLFKKRIDEYKLSQSDLRKYQEQVIKKEDEVQRYIESQIREKERQDAMKPECPYCHSKNTSKITMTSKAVNTAMFGILGEKRKHQWHCNNCKSDF